MLPQGQTSTAWTEDFERRPACPDDLIEMIHISLWEYLTFEAGWLAGQPDLSDLTVVRILVRPQTEMLPALFA